jgi:hypothetical protein
MKTFDIATTDNGAYFPEAGSSITVSFSDSYVTIRGKYAYKFFKDIEMKQPEIARFFCHARYRRDGIGSTSILRNHVVMLTDDSYSDHLYTWDINGDNQFHFVEAELEKVQELDDYLHKWIDNEES